MYFLGNLGFCLFLTFFAGVFAVGVVRWPRLWRQLPRNRLIGEAIAVICLVWAATHVLPMLEGGMARYHIVIKALVPITAILVYTRLNFLLTRALGGLILLLIVYLLHQGFVTNPPLRPVYSGVSYLWAFSGMVLVATPWHLRDLMEIATVSRTWRCVASSVLGASALFYLIYAFAG